MSTTSVMNKSEVIGHGFPKVLVVPKDFSIGMGFHCSNLKEVICIS
ncbi:hypothetical protein VU01_10522 [Candidatus Electrothrix marina]|uniref:Uncharacterized protein n=1 Tax=Candidatus Electrothrix marina TaxID=1859130 RepID=A0A3S4TH11_9BACT|nr:hypothetical protein VU00_10512 [Candidatus Electrothrix marina]RWX51992.1 hypothetical protein VU01_10522 [Candidatus Electrothrix marina]